MTFAILSAKYANAEHTAAEILTEENAAVMIGPDDESWSVMLEGEVADYVAPAPAEELEPLEKLAAFLAANPEIVAELGIK